MTDVVTAVLWLAGSAFALLAAVGVLRMPDVFTRMQASTKASTFGLGCLLLGAALQLGDLASFIRTASIGAFVLLTTPVAGHVIARASYFAEVPLWKGTVLDERKRDSSRGTDVRSSEDDRADQSGWRERRLVRGPAMPDDNEHQHTPEEERAIREAALDQTIEASFPASDPPSSAPNPDDHAALERERRRSTPSSGEPGA